jgi:hypothetical protein
MTLGSVVDKAELDQYSNYVISVSLINQHSTDISHMSVINTISMFSKFLLNFTGNITVT